MSGQPNDDRGARLGLPFTGFVSFLKAPTCERLSELDADVAIVGFPSDDGSGYLPGARFGPRKLREVSMRFRGGVIGDGGGYWDLDEDRTFLQRELAQGRIVDCGDIDIVLTRPEDTWANATAMVRDVVRAGAIPVVLGGDHGISCPIVRGFDEDLTVVHFDAHLDYQPYVHGITHGHANPMRMIKELPFVQRIVHVGIRSFRTPYEQARETLAQGNTIVSTKRLRADGDREVWEAIPEGGRVYVSIDVDVLDPPLVPGTGSPEPGGLTYNELNGLLARLAGHAEVVGFDLVEVNPLIDIPSEVTAFTGTQLIIEFLSRIMDQRA